MCALVTSSSGTWARARTIAVELLLREEAGLPGDPEDHVGGRIGDMGGADARQRRRAGSSYVLSAVGAVWAAVAAGALQAPTATSSAMCTIAVTLVPAARRSQWRQRRGRELPASIAL